MTKLSHISLIKLNLLSVGIGERKRAGAVRLGLVVARNVAEPGRYGEVGGGLKGGENTV